MFSWRKKQEPEHSKEVKEMEAMIAAMTSASLTSLNGDEEGEDVDEEALFEAELAELVGMGVVPKSHPKITKKYNEEEEEDPEKVQLETEDEDNPELLEELASLSQPSVGVPTKEILEQESTAQMGREADEMAGSFHLDITNAVDLKPENDVPYKQESIAFGLEHQVVDEISIPVPTEHHLMESKRSLSEPQFLNEEEKATSAEYKAAAVDSAASDTDNQKSVEKQIAAARMLALKYKRAGDLEAAKDVLRMVRQLEAGQQVAPPLVQKRSPPSEEPAPVKSNQGVTIDRQTAIERLQGQASKALRTSKLYDIQKQPALAQVFKQRTKTILDEIDKLKKSTELSVLVGEVPVSYDVVTPSIRDIKPDELHLGISQIRAEGFGEEACWSFQCTLDSQEKTTSIGALNPKTYHDVIFAGLTRDLKLVKFFEHRKLRIELLRHEPGLWGSLLGRRGVGQPFGASALIKLDTLLKEPSSIETVSFTCKSKRHTLQADISLKVNTPIGSKQTLRIKETWITLRTDQEEPVTRKTSPSGTLPGAIPVEELVSYAVLEEELNKLASLPPQTKSHPAVTTRQFQLESARDMLALKVQIGELSQEDYAKSVSEAAIKFRKQAIAAKKAGDLPLAKSYLEYSKVMEKELLEEDNAE